jgi:tetratricopeptide (TPR) repeat protein
MGKSKKPDNATNALALRFLGDQRLSQKNYAGAIQAYQDALALNPNNKEAWNQVAWSRFLQGDFAGAIRDAERALSFDPNFTHALDTIANARLGLGDIVAARAMQEKAIALDPGNGVFQETIARIQQAQEGRDKIASRAVSRELAAREKAAKDKAIADQIIQGKEVVERAGRERAAREKAEQDAVRLEKLKKLVRVSKKLKLDQMASLLGLTVAELNERIVDWADQFGFLLDEDVVEFSNGRKDEFIAALDESFVSWDKKVTTKEGKLD